MQRNVALLMIGGLAFVSIVILAGVSSHKSDSQYVDRPSLCGESTLARPPLGSRPEVEPGARRESYEIHHSGSELTLTLCTEYGRSTILPSPDENIHIEVHTRAPPKDGEHALAHTRTHVQWEPDEGVLEVRTTDLGFARPSLFAPSRKPADVDITLLLPRVILRLNGTALHGGVHIDDFVIRTVRLEATVGLKHYGTDGYEGGHQLRNVTILESLDAHIWSGSIEARLHFAGAAHARMESGEGDIVVGWQRHPREGLVASIIGANSHVTVQDAVRDGNTWTVPGHDSGTLSIIAHRGRATLTQVER